MNIGEMIDKAIVRHEELHHVIEVTPEQIMLAAEQLVAAGYLPDYDQNAHFRLSRYVAMHKAGDRRGLFLFGNCGTGKTMFARKFTTRRFFTATAIVERYEKYGASVGFDEWLHGNYTDEHVKTPPVDVVIDDLGAEPVSKRYGEVRELLADVIDRRYRYWQDYGRECVTVITSNLSSPALKQRYGMRTIDRICEMCVAIEFKGRSARVAAMKGA
ncbi:MAG: hypothetical protein KKD77_22130 [Gammaproteobacteria bacterium]|nr:hypothetical protein [Gammaproteobacteria bacterium]